MEWLKYGCTDSLFSVLYRKEMLNYTIQWAIFALSVVKKPTKKQKTTKKPNSKKKTNSKQCTSTEQDQILMICMKNCSLLL